MPKIPTFESQGRPTAEVGGVKTSFQVPVTNDVFTKAQSLVANYYIKEKEEEAKIKSLDYENKLLPKLYDAFDKHSKNPFPSEASSSFLKEGKETIQSIVDNELAGENNFVKKRFLQKGNASLSTINLATLQKSRLLMEDEKKKVLNDAKSGIFTELAMGAIDIPFAQQKVADLVNTQISDPDPTVSVNKKKFELDSMYKAIDTLSMQKDSHSDSTFLDRLKKDPNLYSRVDLDDRVKFISYAQNIAIKKEDNRITSEVESFIVDTPYGKQADIVSLITPQLKSKYPDEVLRNKVIDSAQKAYDQKRKIISEQGAAEYFINKDAKINMDYVESIQDPNKFQVFVQTLNKKYDQQQIPDQNRTYLPNNKIKEIGDLINNTTGPNEKLRVINSLKNFYGENTTYIVKQIDKELGGEISLAMSTNSQTIQKLAIMGDLKEDEKTAIRSKTSSSVEIEISKKIRDNIRPLSDIIANQPEGFTSFGQSVEKRITSLTKTAMRGIYEGKYSDANTAANDISNNFLSDYNVANNKFYIPQDVSGKLVNQSFIEAKAEVFKTKLYYDGINLNNFNIDLVGKGGNDLSKQETIDFFKKNGDWYMDGNTGIKFGVKNSYGSFIPMTINKQNIRINFIDGDGEFKNMKDNKGNSYIMEMSEMLNFIESQYFSQLSP